MSEINEIIRRTARVAALWWAEKLKAGDTAAFAASLEAAIAAALDADGECFVDCDYDPVGILLDAVHAAGLECRGILFSADGILPRKHSTEIRSGWIEPKEGYGNWTDVITVS